MPSVSIIIPCYNEEATIQSLLEAIFTQSFPRNQVEVVIADGMSTDKTRQSISAFQVEHPDLVIRVVDNPKRIIPAALNRAIASAQGEVVVRLDGHCVPQPDYLEYCVDDLRLGKGTLVGGVWEIQPGGSSWVARSIARAASHPLAVGDAGYRTGGQPGPVDTVPFGAFYRKLVEKVGFYNEDLLTNEDYEFATRVRKDGGIVWLDPRIRSRYIARKDLASLSRQYWRYGYWKMRMLKRYPGSLRWRQALPPAFLVSLVGLGLISLLYRPISWLLGLELFIYLLVLGVASLRAAAHFREAVLVAGLPLAIATMHTCWGAGFLWSIVDRDTGS